MAGSILRSIFSSVSTRSLSSQFTSSFSVPRSKPFISSPHAAFSTSMLSNASSSSIGQQSIARYGTSADALLTNQVTPQTSTIGYPNAKPEKSRVSERRNVRDHERRLLAAKYELRRKLHKALCNDPDLPSQIRDKHRYKLSKLPRNSAFARVRNRCIFTGRPRAVYEQFRVSRIVFRELASKGALMGVKKASW